MAEFPALPIFTDAYLGDTRHLSAAQHGAYLLLLMTAWRSADCSLPDNDDLLCKWAAMDKRTWLKNKASVMAFWHLDATQKWRQARLSDERKIAGDRRDHAVQAGRASALKRKERHSTGVATPVQPKSNHPNPNPNPNPESDQIRDFLFSGNGEKIVGFPCRSGEVVSSKAIAEAVRISWQHGIEGGEEIGRELEGIFRSFCTEEPRNPDAAFLTWCRGYVPKNRNAKRNFNR